MALPSKYGIEKKINSMEGLSAYDNGGKGSGNFGHSGRPGEVGGSGKSGGSSGGTKESEGSDASKTKLKGPAKTHDEYVYSDASDECKDEYGEVYGALSEHAEWIADAGGFSGGFSKDDYFDLADRLARESDFNRRDKHTQRDLVEGLKKTLKDTREYGLADGSASTDKANDFLKKYDYDSKPNRSADEHDRLMKGAERAWDEKNAFENGGKGSGNFGHAGRPGKVGGSSSGGAGGGRDFDKELKELDREGVPFTSPRYQAVWQDMMKSEKEAKEQKSDDKYDVKDGKEARKYLTADGKIGLQSPESFGMTYDELGKPTRLSRFEKSADDKLWSAWGSMQKIQDDSNLGDVRAEGLATASDAMRLAKAVIATSQTAYLPSERKSAEEQTKKFVKGVKDEVKKAKITLAADTKKYGDTAVRKATRKALDSISSAMDGFLGYENPTREYKD